MRLSDSGLVLSADAGRISCFAVLLVDRESIYDRIGGFCHDRVETRSITDEGGGNRCRGGSHQGRGVEDSVRARMIRADQ
jgi:hypothetical protein